MKHWLANLVVFPLLGAVAKVAVAGIGGKSAGSEPAGSEGEKASRHQGIKCINAAFLESLVSGLGTI